MAKQVLKRIPLILTAVALLSFAPPSPQGRCEPGVWGNNRDNFGQSGRSGIDGRSGRSGRSGPDRSVVADGNTVTLDLSGENGGDGDDGSDGQNAFCDRQPRNLEQNIQAANGGRGGNGGSGGDGGNGGNLMVYYTNPANLKKILVRSVGGQGGRGGRGGRSGAGCNCARPYWDVKTCTGTPGSSDHRCTTRRYTCTDGVNGVPGRDGANGQTGQSGRLSLVPRLEPLAEDAPSRTLLLANLSPQPIALSKNKWVVRTGATLLLASGSVIADNYREFVERLEGSAQLIWQEREPSTQFDGAVTLSLQDNRSIQATFPEDLWVKSAIAQKGSLTEVIVTNAVRRADVTRLSVADFAQSGADLQFSVVDLARKSDILATQFRIKFRTSSGGRFGDTFGDFETRYEGTIPAELVTRDFNRFLLNLGRLPINGQYLSPGTRVEIELVAVRSLGDRSAEQTISWQGRIRG